MYRHILKRIKITHNPIAQIITIKNLICVFSEFFFFLWTTYVWILYTILSIATWMSHGQIKLTICQKKLLNLLQTYFPDTHCPFQNLEVPDPTSPAPLFCGLPTLLVNSSLPEVKIVTFWSIPPKTWIWFLSKYKNVYFKRAFTFA